MPPHGELGNVESAVAMIPGLGNTVAAALAAGDAVIEGGKPLEIAIRTAYGALPIPPGFRAITDVALETILALVAHGGSLTDAAIAAARAAVPDGPARPVFDVLAQLVAKHVPVEKIGVGLLDQFIKRYAAHAIPLPAVPETHQRHGLGLRTPTVTRTATMSTCSLWTIQEAAAFLRTTVDEVASLVARGELPGAVRIGAGVLFRRVELRAYVGLPSASTSQPISTAGAPPSSRDTATSPQQSLRRRPKQARRPRLPVVPAGATVSDLDRAAARRGLRGAGILESKR